VVEEAEEQEATVVSVPERSKNKQNINLSHFHQFIGVNL